MNSLHDYTLESNTNVKFNFDGGELSLDAGVLVINEFFRKLKFSKTLKEIFHTNDTAAFRCHTNYKNLMQMIFQYISGYFEDDCAEELTCDPVFTMLLDNEAVSMQKLQVEYHTSEATENSSKSYPQSTVSEIKIV